LLRDSQDRYALSTYTVQWTARFPSKLPHLMYGSLVQPESTSVPSAVSCRAQERDRPTDRPSAHAAASVTIGRIYVVLRCGLKKTRFTFSSAHPVRPMSHLRFCRATLTRDSDARDKVAACDFIVARCDFVAACDKQSF